MKSKEEWAAEIIKYLQDNPQVEGLEEATAQLETIVGWIQLDALPPQNIRLDS